jgi:hypothetical protein
MGNPIRRHGDNPSGGFTLIRNDLIRRSGLTLAESVVYNILLSHQDGWEVTQDTIARDAGLTRKPVKKALEGLVAKRKLIMQAGKRGHCPFHVNPSRDFTAAEVRGFGKQSPQNLVDNLPDKEDQEQHQLKEQVRAAGEETLVSDNWETQLHEEMGTEQPSCPGSLT